MSRKLIPVYMFFSTLPCTINVQMLSTSTATSTTTETSTTTATSTTTLMSSGASGVQQYLIGWARFHGTGPSSTSSDASVVSHTPVGVETAPDEILILQGLAGSSIPERGWLSKVDKASAAMGACVAIGHLFGLGFYSAMTGIMFRLLFRTHFRFERRLFQPAVKASAGQAVWMTALGIIGYRLAVRYGFNENLISTFHPGDFLCQVLPSRLAFVRFRC